VQTLVSGVWKERERERGRERERERETRGINTDVCLNRQEAIRKLAETTTYETPRPSTNTGLVHPVSE